MSLLNEEAKRLKTDEKRTVVTLSAGAETTCIQRGRFVAGISSQMLSLRLDLLLSCKGSVRWFSACVSYYALEDKYQAHSG